MSNWNNKVIYTGFTSNLIKRIYQHKEGFVDGFTKKYHVNKLVWWQSGDDYDSVLYREKEIKKWRRSKKDELITQFNPAWKDLYKSIL